VWVKVPKTGYVGVGRVTETVCPIKQFTVQTPETAFVKREPRYNNEIREITQ
jgi:hypothetical protein